MREDPVLAAPIESLQLMLRSLSFLDEDLPLLIPDGIFGDATAAAVSAFQKKYAMPVTGIADAQTHRAIVDAYNLSDGQHAAAEAPVVRYPADLIVSPGQSHAHVYLAQAMLAALTPGPYALSGRIDNATEAGLRHIQAIGGLPETGSLDKATYNLLSRLYRLNYDRQLPPSCG